MPASSSREDSGFSRKGMYSSLVNAILGSIHEQDIEKFHTELSDERFEREGRAECEYRIRDKKGEYHYYRQYNAKVNMISGSRMVILIRNIDAFKSMSCGRRNRFRRNWK